MVRRDVVGALLGLALPAVWVALLVVRMALLSAGLAPESVFWLPLLAVLVLGPSALALLTLSPRSIALVGVGSLLPPTSLPVLACTGDGGDGGAFGLRIADGVVWPGPRLVVATDGCAAGLSLVALAATWLLLAVGIARAPPEVPVRAWVGADGET